MDNIKPEVVRGGCTPRAVLHGDEWTSPRRGRPIGGELRLGTAIATLESRDGRYEACGCPGRVYSEGCPTRRGAPTGTAIATLESRDEI
jgi:hypothetical protein